MKAAVQLRLWIMPLLLGLCWAQGSLAGELAAHVEWGQRVTLGTLVAGRVEKVAVRPGQRVEAGVLLLSLDQRGWRARLQAARADTRRAEILRREARTEYERARELYDRTVLSEHELSVAEISLREAEAELASARAMLEEARVDLDHSQVNAPFGGIVVAVNALPGQAVNAENGVPELLVLADDNRLKIVAWVDAGTLDALLASDTPRVKLGGSELPAKQIVPGLEGRESTQGGLRYPVSVLIERPADLAVRAGQAARIVW